MNNKYFLWNFFHARIRNPYGVAGLMGNLQAESNIQSICLEGTFRKKLGLTSEEYTFAVDTKEYENFVNDNAGYGLAQWTYSKHKQQLLVCANKMGKSIGNFEMQCQFLWEDLNRFSSVLRVLQRATSVKEASDDVILRY